MAEDGNYEEFRKQSMFNKEYKDSSSNEGANALGGASGISPPLHSQSDLQQQQHSLHGKWGIGFVKGHDYQNYPLQQQRVPSNMPPTLLYTQSGYPLLDLQQQQRVPSNMPPTFLYTQSDYPLLDLQQQQRVPSNSRLFLYTQSGYPLLDFRQICRRLFYILNLIILY